MNKFFEKSIPVSERYQLKPTGFIVFGMDEYVFIPQLATSALNRSAEGYFKRLLLTGMDSDGLKEFDVFSSQQATRGFDMYTIKDGLGFKTLNGEPVYAEDANGNIIYDDVEVKDEQGNITIEQRGREMLTMFTNSLTLDLTPVNMTLGELLVNAMLPTVIKRIHGNMKP